MKTHEPGVAIREVGMRDGLQSIKTCMPTEAKKRWLEALYAAGVRWIEVTSFVPAKRMPQLADAAEIVAHARTLPELDVTALVPNLRGAEAAFAAGVHRVVIPCSASEAHSVANVRKTRAQMVEEVQRIVALRNALGNGVEVEVGLSVAFGCTLQGEVPERDVLTLMEEVVKAGADSVGLADTTGMGNPAQVKRLFTQGYAVIGQDRLTRAHFHNTRGLGLANCLAAYEVGVRFFDSSLAGLGGCPHAPGASGNVVTEDLVFMFEAMGVRTGIDLPALIAAREPLRAALPDEPLYGMLAEAGLPKGFVHA